MISKQNQLNDHISEALIFLWSRSKISQMFVISIKIG
jgi:hypothetical protein